MNEPKDQHKREIPALFPSRRDRGRDFRRACLGVSVMPLFLKIALGLVCFLAVVAGIFWVWATEPNRKIDRNPIMNEVNKANQIWETRVDLIGTVFEEQQSKSDFETFVENAGFSKDSEFRFYFRKDEVSPNEVVWSAQQGNLICDLEWAVIAEFNESNLLMSADGVVSERGCL